MKNIVRIKINILSFINNSLKLFRFNKINNQAGMSIIEALISIFIVAIGVTGTTRFFMNNLKSSIAQEDKQNRSYIYHDLYHTLSDERNCSQTFQNLAFNGNPSPNYNIPNISDSTGKVLFERQANCTDRLSDTDQAHLKHRVARIDSMVLGARYIYGSDPMKSHATLILKTKRCSEFDKVSSGASGSTKLINLTFLLKQVGANKVVDRCWASGGMSDSGSELTPCGDGEVLVSQGGSFVCSSTVPGVGQGHTFRKLPCYGIAAGGYTNFIGQKCATLTSNNTTSASTFFVPRTAAGLGSDKGYTLYQDVYKAKAKSKLFIETTVPVYSEFGDRASRRYEAPFLLAIFIKPTTAVNYSFVSIGQLYNPFSTPSQSFWNYYHRNNAATPRWYYFDPDNSAGRSGYVTGEVDVNPGVDYHILYKVLSISGNHTLDVGVLPRISFGTIKHNDSFAEGYIKYKEVSR